MSIPLFVSGEGGYRAYRIPAMIVSRRGIVLAFCEGRKKSLDDDGDIDLLLRRSQRARKGLSLVDVAKRTGMARSNLCRLEQNGENVKLETLHRYASALGYELVIEIRDLKATLP